MANRVHSTPASRLLTTDGRLRFRVALAAARAERAVHRDLMARPERFPGYVATSNHYATAFLVGSFVHSVRQQVEHEWREAQMPPAGALWH